MLSECDKFATVASLKGIYLLNDCFYQIYNISTLESSSLSTCEPRLVELAPFEQES